MSEEHKQHSHDDQEDRHELNWPSEWETGEGEATILSHQNITSSIYFYSSWFCPFAQRVWIALEFLNVDYTWIEINPYRIDSSEPAGYTKQALTLAQKSKFYPEFVKVSPKGLVPGLDDDGDKLVDSSVILEYLDERYGTGEMSYMPESPVQKARQRYFCQSIGSIQSQYYALLISQDKKEQERFRETFFGKCREFARSMAPLDQGPFFLGEEISMVDISLFPFWQRFVYVGSHYRDLVFPEEEEFFRLQTWFEAMLETECVAKTLVCIPRLISSYRQYANNTATSNYAKSLNKKLGGLAKNNSESEADHGKDSGQQTLLKVYLGAMFASILSLHR